MINKIISSAAGILLTFILGIKTGLSDPIINNAYPAMSLYLEFGEIQLVSAKIRQHSSFRMGLWVWTSFLGEGFYTFLPWL